MKKSFKGLMFLLSTLLLFTVVSCSDPKNDDSFDFVGTWSGSTLYDDVVYDYLFTVGNTNITCKCTIDFTDNTNFSFQNYEISNDVVSALLYGEEVRLGKISVNTFKFNYYEDISIPPCTLYKN